jgi:hypothetical protein
VNIKQFIYTNTCTRSNNKGEKHILSNGQVTYNFAPVAFRNEYGSKIGMPKGPASKQKGFLKGLKPLRVLG